MRRGFVPGAFRAKHQTLSPAICAIITSPTSPSQFHQHTATAPSSPGINCWVAIPSLTSSKTASLYADVSNRVIGGSTITPCTFLLGEKWILEILPHTSPSLDPSHHQVYATHDLPLYLRLPTLYKHHCTHRSLHQITIHSYRAEMSMKKSARNSINRCPKARLALETILQVYREKLQVLLWRIGIVYKRMVAAGGLEMEGWVDIGRRVVMVSSLRSSTDSRSLYFYCSRTLRVLSPCNLLHLPIIFLPNTIPSLVSRFLERFIALFKICAFASMLF